MARPQRSSIINVMTWLSWSPPVQLERDSKTSRVATELVCVRCKLFDETLVEPAAFEGCGVGSDLYHRVSYTGAYYMEL